MTQYQQGSVSADQEKAVKRWKLGHHTFHLLLITMNTELSEALAQIDEHKWTELTATLHRLTSLYDAATASMKYAADFNQEEYEDLIRPSMSPPYLSPGFSGKANEDHANMLELMGTAQQKMKRLFRSSSAGEVPESVRSAATTLGSAQSRNRRHHMLVCEKFVPGGGSLLKDYFSNTVIK